MNNIFQRFSSVATIVLIASSAVSFAQEDRANAKQDLTRDKEKAMLWQTRGGSGNGCAVGNSAPPGTNC